MMSNPSEICKQWEDFYYWNHTNDQDKHFFKVIFGNPLRGMVLPDKFVRNFKGAIAQTIKLEARNGNVFDVQVANDSEKLVLGHGWGAFVAAHDMRSSDFLVFRYTGDSHFKVLVFDPTGCEKASSCVSLNSMMKLSSNAQSPEIIGNDRPGRAQSPRKAGVRAKPRGDCLSRSKKTKEASSSSGGHSNATEDASSSEDGRSVTKDGGGGAAKGRYHAWCVVGARRVRLSGCIFPRRTRLTRAQKVEVEEKVRAVGSELPLFGTVISRSAVSRQRMVFCREYAREWLPRKEEDQRVSLRRHGTGRSWDVQLEHRRRLRETSALCGGWRRFFRDNRMRAGDIVLLELLNEAAMNAHIIRRHENRGR